MTTGKKFLVLNLSAVFLIATGITLIFVGGFAKGMDNAKMNQPERELSSSEVMAMPLVQIAFWEFILAIILLGVGNPALGLYTLINKTPKDKAPKS